MESTEARLEVSASDGWMFMQIFKCFPIVIHQSCMDPFMLHFFWCEVLEEWEHWCSLIHHMWCVLSNHCWSHPHIWACNYTSRAKSDHRQATKFECQLLLCPQHVTWASSGFPLAFNAMFCSGILLESEVTIAFSIVAVVPYDVWQARGFWDLALEFWVLPLGTGASMSATWCLLCWIDLRLYII